MGAFRLPNRMATIPHPAHEPGRPGSEVGILVNLLTAGWVRISLQSEQNAIQL